MIRISCTNCKTVLTIDDAFAGGVCRCQHCGTIQTVPTTAAGTEVSVGGPNLGGGRVSAGGDGGPGTLGTGLDDLAGAIASSGLSSRRLTRPPGPAMGATAIAPAAKGRHSLVPLFIAAGAVIVILVGVIVYLATRGPAPVGGDTGVAVTSPPLTDGTHGPEAPGAPPSPAFCGVRLDGDTVVYVLDRGTATQEVFSALKEATLKSAASLGSGRHFQVVFWANGSDDNGAAYPPTGTAYASEENVGAARRAIDDVVAFGQTEVKSVLPLALAAHPDVIVLATAAAKASSLDDAWLADVVAARGPAAVRFDTFSLNAPVGGGGETTPLKTLAAKTGGTYQDVTDAELNAAAE